MNGTNTNDISSPLSGERNCYFTDLTAENGVLRYKIFALENALRSNEENAERIAGSAEYELEQFKERHAVIMAEYVTKLAANSIETERLLDELRESRQVTENYKAALQHKVERLDQLETYLAKLPTAEEYNETLRQLQLTQQRLVDLEKRLNTTQAMLERCESRLGEEKAKVKRAAEREQLLQTQLDGAMQRMHSQNASGSSANIHVTPEFVEDLKYDLDRYRASFEQAKKLLEAETHRAEAAESRRQMEKRQFEEQLAREEATLSGLRNSLSHGKTEIIQLKKHITRLNSDKQDLLERLLRTRASLAKAVVLWKSVAGQKRLRLLRDLTQTVNEAVCLSEHLDRLSSGEKLDVSDLLFQPQTNPSWSILLSEFAEDSSQKRTSEQPATVDDEMSIDMQSFGPLSLPTCETDFLNHLPDVDLNALIQSVQQARTSLMRLRQQLADRYAEHLGGKLECRVH
ncbi:Centrosomal protein of 85 kDa [Paragonimus skrjabini miyazakii]|uniref:Centrosomal protein of 85 kDa n=1 Tax=Paragonimus skrjabini miyazakii TaxID=59628 RepID=A0A8S9YS35_9TREM|nr:Centrosomal protein of 85 kDa [Paragonimus skrjabini miyazakii]